MPAPFIGIGIAPRVDSARSLATNRVRVVFSESMGAGASTAANYSIAADVGSDARTVLSANIVDDDEVDLTLDGDLSEGVDNYAVTVINALDVAGNVIDPAFDTADFSGFFAAIPAIADHCELAKARLLEQFKDKTRLNALLCALADQAQPIEQAGADILAFRSIETAFGATLDLIGVNLHQARDGLLDGDYRVVLRAKARVLGSRGRPDELEAILAVLDDGFSPSSLTMTEDFPAGFRMHAVVPTGGELRGERYARLIREAKPAGVYFVLDFEEDGVALFSWAENVPEGDADPGPGTSWAINVPEGDTTPDAGGTWAEATSGDNAY